MGYYIQSLEKVQSHLDGNGIETILIPLESKRAIAALMFDTRRGGQHGALEFLLTEIGRTEDMDRVCGLAIDPQDNIVLAQIQLKQPGKQLEEWLKDHKMGKYQQMEDGSMVFSDSSYITGGPALLLSARAMDPSKWTEKHKPWWEEPLIPQEQWSNEYRDIKLSLGIKASD